MENASTSKENTLEHNEKEKDINTRNLNNISLQEERQVPNEHEKHVNRASIEQEIQAPNEKNPSQEKPLLPVCGTSNTTPIPCNSTTIKTAVPGVIMINFSIEDIGETAVITISNIDSNDERKEEEIKNDLAFSGEDGSKSKEVQLKKQNQNKMENHDTENSEDLVSNNKELKENNELTPFHGTQHNTGIHRSFAAVRFKIERDAESNLLVQDIKINKHHSASFNEEPKSQHQSDATESDATTGNSLKKAVIKIKKLTKKEIDAHSYAGKYCVEAKRKTKKKHKKHKKDRKKHKNSLKLNSSCHISSEVNTVTEARKTTLTNEITHNSKKRTVICDKREYRPTSKENKGAITTSFKKVKMQHSIAKPSTPIKRKRHYKDNQQLAFQEEELFYPPDRMVTISSHTKEKKVKSDRNPSVSEVNYPRSLEDKSTAKDATNEKKDPGTTPDRSIYCGTNQNKNGTFYSKKERELRVAQSSSAQKKLVTKSVVDPEIKEIEDSSDDSSTSLFSTDSSLPMDILEKLFESSSESSPSEFEGF